MHTYTQVHKEVQKIVRVALLKARWRGMQCAELMRFKSAAATIAAAIVYEADAIQFKVSRLHSFNKYSHTIRPNQMK